MIKKENHVHTPCSLHSNPLNVHFSDHHAKHNVFIKCLTYGLPKEREHIKVQNIKTKWKDTCEM